MYDKFMSAFEHEILIDDIYKELTNNPSAQAFPGVENAEQPSPFFVLDEIDAALDNTNINRVVNYIKHQTAKNFQCIVISLKEEFFTKVNTVVGVTADPDKECTTTRTLTLDLRNYPE